MSDKSSSIRLVQNRMGDPVRVLAPLFQLYSFCTFVYIYNLYISYLLRILQCCSVYLKVRPLNALIFSLNRAMYFKSSILLLDGYVVLFTQLTKWCREMFYFGKNARKCLSKCCIFVFEKNQIKTLNIGFAIEIEKIHVCTI